MDIFTYILAMGLSVWCLTLVCMYEVIMLLGADQHQKILNQINKKNGLMTNWSVKDVFL
jgi:hypothetical protein